MLFYPRDTQAALAAELGRRREALRADLNDRGADALLVTREANVTYLTGYTTSTWTNFSRPIAVLLFAEHGNVVAVCSKTEADAMLERVPEADVEWYVELSPVDEHTPLPDGRVQFSPAAAACLERNLASRGARRLAVDGLGAAFPPIAQLTELFDSTGFELLDASEILWKRRMIKSTWEQGRIAAAAAVLERAFDRLRETVRPGMTERQIHAELVAGQYLEGAHGLGYTQVIAGTDRGLFGAPTERVWKAGELLFVDGGLTVDGYWSDFCRTFSAGAPSARQRDGYARAHNGLKEALAQFRPGMPAGELGAVIGKAIKLLPHEVGFGRFGHGIGLYMPEPPSLHRLDTTVLDEGVTLCVEPAVVHEGMNFVVEEEHVVRGDGLVLLSPEAPARILEV